MEDLQLNTTKEELDELIVALRDIKKEFIMNIPGVAAGIDDMLRDFQGYREMLDLPSSILLMGRTGAGKSSLINALLGTPDLLPVGESAFSETKHVEAVETTTKDGTRLVFLDTRGSGEAGFQEDVAVAQFEEAARIYKPAVAMILMPPDRSHWDEDISFFSRALKATYNRLQTNIAVVGIVTKMDIIVDPFDPSGFYNWQEPSTKGEEKVADWCNRLKQSLERELEHIHSGVEVYPVCTKFGTNDEGKYVDLRYGLDELWDWLGKHAPFELLLGLSEFAQSDRRKALATSLVHRFAIMASVVGALPISFADAPVLTYLQQVLVRVIYAVAGTTDKPAPKEYIRLLGGTTTIVGKIVARQLVTSLAELVPGWGTLIGSAGNAAVAAAFTEMFGQAAIRYYFDGIDVVEVLQIMKNFKIRGKSK